MKIKRYALCFFLLTITASIILYPVSSVSSARRGILLWFDVIFPSIFPFLVLSEALQKTGFLSALGKLSQWIMKPLFNLPGCSSFAIIIGIISGYPVGAKITVNLVNDNLITKSEGERLLAFSNNSGPLFIIGAVACTIFETPQFGMILYLSHIIACLMVGIIYGITSRYANKNMAYNSQKSKNKKKPTIKTFYSFNDIVGDSIVNSVTTILYIGGYIIFFSVIINTLIETHFISIFAKLIDHINILGDVDTNFYESIICGIFEITTGIDLIHKNNNLDLIYKLIATSFITGWAGISIHAQVAMVANNANLSIKPYLFGKFLQGVFASIITCIFLFYI